MKERPQRHKKSNAWLVKGAQVVGAIVAAVGAVYLLISSASDDNTYTPQPNTTDLRAKYTPEWFSKASLDTLETERLRVQGVFLNMDSSVPSYWDVSALINEFDEAITKKKSGLF